MLKRILIANRGEIALRIIRTCREMGIPTVAVYSAADRDALHIQLATQSVCIGGAKASESYLNETAILTAATMTGCDAIHPGYGFLSENADFAALCEEHGIKFIGPPSRVIQAMGNKAAAKALMKKAGVPVIPGSDGPLPSAKEAASTAESIGYPVLLKASSGGGGRGIRRVDTPEDMATAFAAVKGEATACFGDDEIYLEKLILNPKHIEFQILADSQGNAIHLGERDCSIQRRSQKLVEEAPSRGLSPALREKMGVAAVAAAKASHYENAGTVEFLLTETGEFYFMEMNTRIQVEHPVTEMITGIDLVREQIRIAAGRELSIKNVKLTGHAIECRINCEDPSHDFMPAPGTTRFLHLPGGVGVRVDTALYNSYAVSPFYDSLLAKVVVHAPTRLAAIKKMRRALEELIIDGYPTTADLDYLIMYHPEFVLGRHNTGFMDKNLEELTRLLKETKNSKEEG